MFSVIRRSCSEASMVEAACRINSDSAYNLAFLRMINYSVQQLVWFQDGKLSDAELNERINYANEQIIGDGGKPSSPISLPHPADGENAGKSRNPTYRTLQERFKNLPPFMRTDLTFNVIIQAYRTVGQPGTAWRPGEMDDTMDKVAYLTAAICQRVFGESALWNLCNQFNHSDVRSMIFWDLSPRERKELEMRMERAAFHAGWGGWDEDSW